MYLFIITGPPGAGKNTIAKALAQKVKRCVVIDVDLVRWMVIKPHKAPWEGHEGKSQQELGVKNTCMLAKNFLKQQYNVVITDVVSDTTATLYKKELKEYLPKIILLLPTYTEIKRRNVLRPPRLKEEEIKMLYQQQKEIKLYDIKIDNTILSVNSVVEKLPTHVDD